MDKIDSMRAFVKVVEENGFAAAARRMGLSRSVVNKSVIRLEEHLGAQLLVRSTRSVRPTDLGLAFYDRCVQVLGDFDAALDCAREAGGEPSGTLRVNAPMSFGLRYLSPLVARFMADHPDVRIELVLTDRFVDPLEEGFDVTVRAAEQRTMTALISRPIAPARRVMCASPAYLEQHGVPQSPLELRSHRCLHYGHLASGSQWRLGSGDSEQAYRIQCVLWSNNGDVLCDAAVSGEGITLLPTFIVGEHIAAGLLTEVLTHFRPPDIELVALYPRHRHLSTKVRAFVDYLEQIADDIGA